MRFNCNVLNKGVIDLFFANGVRNNNNMSEISGEENSFTKAESVFYDRIITIEPETDEEFHQIFGE